MWSSKQGPVSLLPSPAVALPAAKSTTMTGALDRFLGESPIVTSGRLLFFSSFAGTLMTFMDWSPEFIFDWVAHLAMLFADVLNRGATVIVPLFVLSQIFSRILLPEIREGFWALLSRTKEVIIEEWNA